MKLSLAVMIFSVLLLANSFAQSSFGLGEYDYISEWGSFGITGPGHFSHPQFIAVGDDGNIYVSDLGNKRVQKFSSNGEYITEWGKSGKQSGEFHYPSGIAVSDDFVYVADRELNRIQKFSLDGEFVTKWGEKGSYDGQLYFPNGIAVNNGTVYVADTGNQRIQIFSTDGEFISSFGSSGLGEGQFLTIIGIDIDADGNVYVTDRGNSKVEKFSPNGELIQSFPFHSSNYIFTPEAITIDSTGKMFIVNSANDRILYLSQNSDLKLNIFDQLGPYTNSFNYITDIAIGINGELLVVDSANHKIKSFETEFYEKPVIVDSIKISDVIEDLPIDKTRPVIIAPPSLEVEAVDMLTVVLYGEATATDESGIKAIINNAPDAFSLGVSTIIWIAFDNTGYSSSTSQTITVKTCGNTYSDYNIITGTQGDDVIQGTDGDDLIFGLAGNDVIFGGKGNDCIFGGFGDDTISGGDGDDTIKGNSGNDILKGQSGNDLIYSNSGSDVIDGGDGTDRCYSTTDSQNDLLLNCEG
ncbi:MAG: 6-bladed beta-propeller [Thaumarchaeota archaeon]|nr:6-bladed beta-propeller [Nitrososphaerota archaeon]